MAHNLNFNEEKQQYSFVAVGKAWHNLGQVVEKAMSSIEAIELAHMGYLVEKQPIEAVLPDGTRCPVSDKFATVRMDTNQALGIVGKRYEVYQNNDAFSFLDSIVDGKEAMYETAGALNKGERVFITVKFPSYITIGADKIEDYCVFSNSHDGSDSLRVMFTPVRVVCNNTLNAAIKQARSTFTMKHTKNIRNKMQELIQIIGLKNNYIQTLETVFNNAVSIKNVDSREFVHSVFLTKDEISLIEKNNGNIWSIDEISTRAKNQVQSVLDYVDNGIGQKEFTTQRGSLYWIYQGVNGWLNNAQTYKDNNMEDRFLDLVDTGGWSYKKNQTAMDLMLQLS